MIAKVLAFYYFLADHAFNCLQRLLHMKSRVHRGRQLRTKRGLTHFTIARKG